MKRIAVGVIALLASTSAAAADLLTRGLYVRESARCWHAPDRDTISYHGEGRGRGFQQVGCTIRTIALRDSVYSLSRRCGDARSGGALWERLTVSVRNPRAFTVRTESGGEGRRFRYCDLMR